MAKKKNKLNKSNSSGWLDNFSEELTINEYQQGGPIKDYRVNNQMVSDNTRNQYNQNTNQFTAEELKAIEKESNKRAADKKKVIDDRKQRVKKSIEAQNKPLSIQNLADLTQATGDKFRLFPNEESFIDDYVNPLVMVGDMASGLGRLPLDIQQGNYGNAALSLATPVTAGALASIGAQNTGEFLNNAFNPIAGTGNLVKDKLGKVVKSNLEKESVKRFLEKPRFAIGRKEYLPETLSFDFQELGGDDFAVILRGPDNAIEANLSLFKSSENWFKPGIISVDPRLQGNRIQDILYQKGLEEAQKRNFVGIRSGDYLIEPEKTLKAHERFETIPLLPDATTKDKNIPIVGMLAHKNKNLYEDFFKQYEALPKEIRAKYSIKDIYNTFKDILPGSSDSKAVSYNYGGEVNEYQKGGKVSPEESTLSKLKKALSLRENLGNLNTEQGYNTPLSQILRTAVGMEGKDLSNESMDPIAREQDAFRMYLGLPSRTGAFEQTGPNKYRIRDYNKLYPDTLLSDEAVRDWGTPYEDGVPDPVNPAFDLYPYDDFVMGKHYITKGKDAKGEYLRYYDKFNLDPTRRANQYIDRNINPRVGKYLKRVTPVLDELENLMFNPFELEDKVYYDPKTKLRSDIILQRNKQRVVPGQPVAIPAEFQGGGDVNNIPSWAYDIPVDDTSIMSNSVGSVEIPNWWFSTQKMDNARKQKHFNAIVNDMIDSGISLNDVEAEMNNFIGYGEGERNYGDYHPTIGFDKGDVNTLLKNYNPNNFKNGGKLGGLDRWFAEKWVDVKTGKECGRQKGEKRKGYPACRPSKRISSETPKTASELSAAEKAKFKREKTSSERIDYNHKKQDGGNIGNTLETNPYYKEANQFLLDYYNSPRYKEMISNSAPENTNYFTENRIANLTNTPPLNLPKKDKGLVGGFSDSKTGEITIYPNNQTNISTYLHELTHNSDRPITKQDFRKNMRLIPDYDKQLIEQLLYPDFKSKISEEKWNQYTDSEKKDKEKFYSNKIKNYIGKPEEVRARLLEIRKSGKDANIYDPFTQKVDYPILKKLLMSESERLQKNDKGNYPLLDLIEGFDADGVLQMLNEISQNKDENSLPMAKNGGKINDDNGYLISNLDNFTPKKIINSNYITTNNMAFPVDANGVILYPNTGDYVFPTNKVIETPIMQDGGKINNDMKKKFKKYQGGGYLNYQDAYKGFGVGPNLTQDNSYYRTAVPGTIENINAQINQPSVFSGINDVLGSVNQGVNQITGLMSQLPQTTTKGNNIMPDVSWWGKGGASEGLMQKTDAQLNWENDQKLKQAGLFNDLYSVPPTPTVVDPSQNLDMTGIEEFDMSNLWSDYFNPSKSTNPFPSNLLGSVSQQKNGGYLNKYQNGGMMDMPVGYPEYLHKSNVFAEHVIPVPKVHFSDDTSVFDMGVNLNDLVQMNGGGIGKYQYGGFMTQPRTFNSNSQRMNAAQLSAATENDFMHTKLRNDRQQFADNKVDWGALNFLKEPTGAYLGMMSNVPIVGNTINSALGDSFLTRTKGYKVGQGVGKTTFGAGKIAGGVALTIAGQPQQGISMIGQGVGDVGSGVGSTVGNLNARSAMEDYNKEGYVSGKRMEKSSQDFGNMMYTASDLFGNIYGGVNQMKGLGGMSGNMQGGQKGMQGFGNIMQNLSGMGGQGAGGFNFSQLAGMMRQDGGYLDNYQEGGMVFLPEDLEIPKFKKGGLTAKKAREILHDKSVHGKPLTDKQRKYFGYISSQKKSNGGWIDTL